MEGQIANIGGSLVNATNPKNKKFTTCNNSWDYDTSEWKRTIIHEWNLVCDREPLLKLTQQVTFFGLLCGAFLSGVLSDRYASQNYQHLINVLPISNNY